MVTPETARMPLTQLPEWQALLAHEKQTRQASLSMFFAQDSKRAQDFSAQAAGLYLDYSKQRVTGKTLQLLQKLGQACHLQRNIQAMFSGQDVNFSEHRPALHVALRMPAKAQDTAPEWMPDRKHIAALVQANLKHMTRFCEQLRSGQYTGGTGRRIRNIVNIGIGGSDLGPMMAYEALKPYSQRNLNFRFVSNADGSDLHEAIRDLQAAETLFIVCSKSFGTQETLINADAARAWCAQALGDEQAVARHFLAVTANTEKARNYGIHAQHIFQLWDWVGGRYSLASAVGLSTMIAIGPDNFNDMMRGMHAMDRHFIEAAPEQNLPRLMGLLAVWNNNFLGACSMGIFPYADRLKYFPAYLQQLAMESNGKCKTHAGAQVNYHTSPIYWGQAGSNGQHSFFQLLHQGTHIIPCDFIGFAQAGSPLKEQHDVLMANMFAQSQALAFGTNTAQARADGCVEQLARQRECAGNRPSNSILAQRLDPFTLGALIALYEHSIFVQGTIWGINSFDQWGVELGKQLAQKTLTELRSPIAPELHHDSSTNALIQRYRALRNAD